MLDALLGEGAVSDEAVRDWAAAVDIDALDAASYRLPKRLADFTIDDWLRLRPLTQRLKTMAMTRTMPCTYVSQCAVAISRR